MTPADVAQMKQRDNTPYLGEVAYEAFWQVAHATGAVEKHEQFATLNDNAQWAWHAAGVAAVAEVAG